MEQAVSIAVQILMGVALAASAGLRAFLPLLVVGAAGRLGWIPLSDGFRWLAADASLVVFGIAVVVEIAADKFPVVDHALDVVQTFVKPVAGAVLVASVVTDLRPLPAAVLAIVLGGTVAGTVHVVKAKTRLLSTATTAGTVNPVLSVGEDAGSLLGSVAALVVPVLVGLVAVVALVGLAAWGIRRRPGSVRPAGP